MEKQNFRAKEASVYIGVGLSTVWLYAKQGKLNPIKLSERVTIFKKEDLDSFINFNSFSKQSEDQVDKIISAREETKKDSTTYTNLKTIDAKNYTGVE